MQKKLVICLTVIFLVGATFYFFTKQSKPQQWQTYNKVNHDKVESYPTTKTEIKKYKLPTDLQPEKKRTPAAVAPSSKNKRELVNPMGKKIAKKLKAKNKISKEWEQRLGQNLLRFLRPDTSLFVKKQKSVSLIENDGIRHAEIVIIQLKSPEGRRYSYNAYVDSESGKVLQTWNRTIHEFYGEKPKRLMPTGSINQEGSTQF